MKVDLSIDFDFFIREDWKWDFGHREEMIFFNTIWHMRYGSIDLVKETDPKVFADFEPSQIFLMLKEKGFDFSQCKTLHICESHLGITTAFEKDNDAEKIISLDAHHDFFPKKKKLDCGSWLRHFMNNKKYKKAVVVYPKWKDMKEEEYDDIKNRKDIETVKWSDLPKRNYKVQRIFVCRSGCWVAPHHDKDFNMMATILSFQAKDTYTIGGVTIDPMQPREIDWDGIAEFRNQLKDFRKERMKKLQDSKKPKKYSKIIEPFDNYHFWGKCQTCKEKRMLVGIRKKGDTFLGQCMKCGQMDVKSIKIKNKSKGGKKARKKKKKKIEEKVVKVFVTKHAYIRIMQRRDAFRTQIKYIEDVKELVKTAFKEGIVKHKGAGSSKILEYGPFFFVIRPDKKREYNYVVVSFTHGFPPEGVMHKKYYIKTKSSGGRPFEYDKVWVTFDSRCHRLDEKIKRNEKVEELDCGDAVEGIDCSLYSSPASKKERGKNEM